MAISTITVISTLDEWMIYSAIGATAAAEETKPVRITESRERTLSLLYLPIEPYESGLSDLHDHLNGNGMTLLHGVAKKDNCLLC